MADDVLQELLGPAGANPQALIDQLRRQRALGQVGALSGDKRIAALGGGVAQDAVAQAQDIRDRRDRTQAREDQQGFARWQQEQAMKGRADELDFRKQSLAQARALAEAQMANQREIAGLKKSTSANLSPFEKRYQAEVAKEASDWDNQGAGQVQAALNDIDYALKKLKDNPNIGKSRTTMLPDWARGAIDPEGVDVQNRANRVSVNSIRPALGGQFTQQESERFQALDYNPNMSNEVNRQRLEEKKRILENAVRRKNALFGQFRQGMVTMEGQTIDTVGTEDVAQAIAEGRL